MTPVLSRAHLPPSTGAKTATETTAPLPQLFTPAEVAKILRLSPNTVIARFAGREGVIMLASGGTEELRERYRAQQKKKGRKVKARERYRRILIPRFVLDSFIAENTAQKSTPVNVGANRKQLRLQRSQDAMQSRIRKAQ